MISDITLKKKCYSCSSNVKDALICLEFRAKQLRDKTICDLMDTNTAKKACLAGLNAKTTVAGCEQPESLLDFKLCKQFAIAQVERTQTERLDAKKERTKKQNQVMERQAQIKAAKSQQAKTAKAEKAEAKAARLQEAKAAKAQVQAQRLSQVKQQREAKAKMQADRIFKAKQASDEKEAKIKSCNLAKTQERLAKLQAAKEKREAQTQQKADKIKKAKEAKQARLELKTVYVQTAASETPSIAVRGCTKGFGAWAQPPQAKNEQYLCDKENIEQFKPLINRCLTTDRNNVQIMSFDINKDGCATCADLHQWRRQVKELYQAKKRLADGHYLNILECQDRKF